jgi:mannose-6-phosphate isomerase-like protein (cupin superfamily)
MAEYTIVSVADVPDQAAEVGMDPEHFEIRFLRESLGLRNFSVTFERFGGGWQPPQGHPHRRGHRHTIQEEVYFLVSGRAQGKFEGEVVDIAPWTAVRVPPETARSFRAAGEEDAVFVTIGAPQAGVDDVEFIPDYWTDEKSARVRAACQSRPSASNRPAARSIRLASSRTTPRARNANGSR